jgi:hypothetical protein
MPAAAAIAKDIAIAAVPFRCEPTIIIFTPVSAFD